MNTEEKIKLTLKEDRVFQVQETNKYDYYVCRGTSSELYDVIFHKYKDSYSCNCKNVRNTECYHIKCVKILREDNDDETPEKADIFPSI